MARRAVRVIGPGRAGRSALAALEKAGWRADAPLGRGDAFRAAAAGVDLLLIATPDAAVAEVAASVAPVATTVVAHLAGSLGLDVLEPHERRASMHPLRAIPTPTTDLSGAWFAVAGDRLATEAVDDIGGRPISVRDDHASRAAYHAAAVVASNHLVALLGQVERIAAEAGVPLVAFLDLARGAIDNVAAHGPTGALTGPVARGDWDTVRRHLDAIPADEGDAYVAMARQAARLCGREAESEPLAR
ncbi:MAG TPA: DUF2520 domain-containing protein [Acidimicrobiales bacterium]